MIKAGQGAGPSLGIQGLAVRKGTGWKLSGPLLPPRPPWVRLPWKLDIREFWYFQLSAGHASRLWGQRCPVTLARRWSPRGQNTEEACGLRGWGKLASLLSCSRWPGGLLASSKTCGEWGKPSLAGA